MALDKFRAAPIPNPPAHYDPQYIRLGGMDMTNADFENQVSNMRKDIKDDTLELYIGNNKLTGKISLKEFPNLKSISCL